MLAVEVGSDAWLSSRASGTLLWIDSCMSVLQWLTALTGCLSKLVGVCKAYPHVHSDSGYLCSSTHCVSNVTATTTLLLLLLLLLCLKAKGWKHQVLPVKRGSRLILKMAFTSIC
jgi:hypothetical protein